MQPSESWNKFVLQDQMELPEKMVNQEQMVAPKLMIFALTALKDLQVHQDHKDQKVHQESLELTVCQVFLSKDRPVLQDVRVPQEYRDQVDQKGLEVRQANTLKNQDHQVHLVLQARQVSQERMVYQDLKVNEGFQAPPAHQVQLEKLAFQEPLVNLERQGSQVKMEVEVAAITAQ